MGIPLLSKRLLDLQKELKRAQRALVEQPDNLEGLEQVQDKSGIAEISKQVVEVSSVTQETQTWADRELEAKVLRTKLNGVLTQLNIQIGHRNRFEIEKAKYGGIGIPPRLDTAIEEINAEIEKLEVQEKDARAELAKLMTS